MGNATFAERIGELRKSKGWTLEELGSKVGLGKTAVQNWEKNGAVPNEEILRSLSKLFQSPIDYLLGNEKMMSESNNVLFRNWDKLSDDDKDTINQMMEIIINKKGK